jgi:hypothetical protein
MGGTKLSGGNGTQGSIWTLIHFLYSLSARGGLHDNRTGDLTFYHRSVIIKGLTACSLGSRGWW